MSRAAPNWRCQNWMGGVTCQKPIINKKSKSKRYEVRRFPSRSAYDASDLHPSRRNKTVKASRTSTKRPSRSNSRKGNHDHKLRVRQSKKMPTTVLGQLSAIPPDSHSDPFTTPRQWVDGTLPSFRALGAIGKGAFGGVVIYPDGHYKKQS